MLATRFRILGETLRVRLVQELQNGEKTAPSSWTQLSGRRSVPEQHAPLLNQMRRRP